MSDVMGVGSPAGTGRVRLGAGAAFDGFMMLLLIVLASVALVLILLVPLRFLPAEDAAILFQYSRNLALHGAITYVPNGPKVEGATDFAWMVLLAGGMRLGAAPLWICAVVNDVAVLTVAALLVRLAGLRLTVRRVLLVAGPIVLVPQVFAAAAGFAVLADAALLTALVFCVVNGRARSAALVALGLCLFRPDGVVFAIPLLMAMVWRSSGLAERWSAFLAIIVFFVLPGIAYFLWRWRYFGELFPLPFLVKSDTPRTFGLFVPWSIPPSIRYLEFGAVLLAPVFLMRRGAYAWLMVPLVICPTFFYWAMRLDQNVGARFFYYLPLAAAMLIALNWPELGRRRGVVLRTGFMAWLVLLAGPYLREFRTFRDMQFVEVKAIAEALGRLPQAGTILTSEAGFLPYFSGWTTYDAWGLNTPEFAHRFVQSSDVARLAPDLVVFHPDWGESCLRSPSSTSYGTREWSHMTRNLVLGAESGQYEVWLTSYGSEFYRQRKHWQYGEGDRECWLVRLDSPRYAAMTEILREHHGIAPPQAEQLELEHPKVSR